MPVWNPRLEFHRLPIWINKSRLQGHVNVLNNYSSFFTAQRQPLLCYVTKLFMNANETSVGELIDISLKLLTGTFRAMLAPDATWLMTFRFYNQCSKVIKSSQCKGRKNRHFFFWFYPQFAAHIMSSSKCFMLIILVIFNIKWHHDFHYLNVTDLF